MESSISRSLSEIWLQHYIYPFPETCSKGEDCLLKSISEDLSGKQKIEGSISFDTPNLCFDNLIAQMYNIQKDVCNTEKVLKDYISVYDALKRLEVFIVNSDNVGQIHSVRNLFSQELENICVPPAESFGDDQRQALGCYVPATGSIYLWIDRICNHKDKQMTLQYVLLHEIIHMFFDVIRKSANKDQADNEECINNFLALHCYANANYISCHAKEHVSGWLKNFISDQPKPYKNAVDLYEKNKGWFAARKIIFDFLNYKRTN